MPEPWESPTAAIYDMLNGKRVRVDVYGGSHTYYTISGKLKGCEMRSGKKLGNLLIEDCAKSFEELFGMPYEQLGRRDILILGGDVRSVAPEADGCAK